MENPASPRDGNGRFAAGNPGGPGRSKGRGSRDRRVSDPCARFDTDLFEEGSQRGRGATFLGPQDATGVEVRDQGQVVPPRDDARSI